MGRLVGVIFFLLIPFLSFTQAYNFLQYDVDDGMTNATVVAMTEDHLGYLWLATQGGGLNRFDGVQFEYVTTGDGLASNFVRDVLVDKSNNLWAATAAGISRYDGSKIVNYLNRPGKNNSVNVLAEDGNENIWFSFPDGGIGFLKEDSISSFNSQSGFVDDMVIDILYHNDVIWILTNIHGLYKYEEGEFQKVISNMKFGGYLLSLSPGNFDELLIATSKGLLRFDPKNPEALMQLDIKLSSKFVRSVTRDKEGNFWIALADGVVRSSQGILTFYGENEGFPSRNVHTMYTDREGNIWLGTQDKGLYRFHGDHFTRYDKRHGYSGYSVTTLLEDSTGNILVGSNGGGIEIISNGIIQQPYDDLPSKFITCSYRDSKGSMWFGTREGLLQIKQDSYKLFTSEDGLVNNIVKSIIEDDDGNIWIGTIRGLSKYDQETFYNYSTAQGLSSNNILQLIRDTENNINIVTQAGVSKVRGDVIKNMINNPKLFSGNLNLITFDKKGNLWLGYSGNGLVRLDRDKSFFQKITRADGLSSDFILNLVWDNEGNLIVGTERGIDKILLNDNLEVEFIKNYGDIEGFQGLKTSYQSAFKDSFGNIWFGGGDQLYCYRQEHGSTDLTTPVTHINDFRLFYNSVDWENEVEEVVPWTHLPKNLKLPYYKNHIILDYKGISLSNPEEVKYKFKLENLEKDWSPTTYKKEAAYTNLPPGKYVFKVKAANSDGVWSTDEATFSFIIKTPFWQQYWFYALVVLVVIVLMKLLHDFRVRKRIAQVMMVERIRNEEMQKVRKHMARDFHDNMGNQLASITVFVNLISMRLKDKSPEVSELLEKIQKHSNSLYTGTKDFIWSMDPKSDEIHAVFTHIKDFGEELYKKTEKEFYSEIALDFPEKVTLPSGFSRQIVLIFKEAMTNALKHSNGDKIFFNLSQSGEKYQLTLRDNGTIDDNIHNKKGKGLQNMKARAKQIDADLDINSDQGLEIKLRLNSK